MKFTQNNLKTLNLSVKEANILNTLSTSKPIKITSLAKLSKIPRTSVEFILKNLKQRGLVEKVKIKNHNEWQKVDDLKLATKFREVINNLDVYSEIIGKIENKSIIIEVFQNKKKIIEAASKILKFNPAHRVFYIQCPNSAEYQINKLPKKFILEFHKKIKKSGIIMEAIAAESILPYFDKLSRKELESHIGRTMVNYLVPDEYVNFGADIIMHGDLIIILNYDDETVIFIKNKLLANIFSRLFEFILSFSRKLDLNQYMQKRMEVKQ